ncbi:hypothetical protein SAMN04487989_103135 [Bizionia echini]|uniref:Holin-X, holin superfamily III n=1 Tax=Bizionia echini TaxID=649333 RepID=A0A1I5BHF7_9FLAO|nr:hypothetical protein [Bizionia echini]SFN74097.1 hypothetical protein SAMN04487989_103135 [Bizionia echini]
MNVFESIGDKTDRATDIGEKYIKVSHQYFRLKLFQQLTFSVSMVAKLVVIGAFIILGIIFGAVAVAISIGNFYNSLPIGYLSVAMLFFLLGLILYFTRKSINTFIIKKMSLKFFTEDD